jgi:hypothetical protein
MADLASCFVGHGVEPGAKLTFELDHYWPPTQYTDNHGGPANRCMRSGIDFATDRKGPVQTADDCAACVVRVQKPNNIREKCHA